jgi:hypothetical protein
MTADFETQGAPGTKIVVNPSREMMVVSKGRKIFISTRSEQAPSTPCDSRRYCFSGKMTSYPANSDLGWWRGSTSDELCIGPSDVLGTEEQPLENVGKPPIGGSSFVDALLLQKGALGISKSSGLLLS